MPLFTKRIDIPKTGRLEFTFNRIYTVNGIRFMIYVLDKNHVRHLINMDKEDDNWIILSTEKTPNWILEIEKLLSEAITAHLNSR